MTRIFATGGRAGRGAARAVLGLLLAMPASAEDATAEPAEPPTQVCEAVLLADCVRRQDTWRPIDGPASAAAAADLDGPVSAAAAADLDGPVSAAEAADETNHPAESGAADPGAAANGEGPGGPPPVDEITQRKRELREAVDTLGLEDRVTVERSADGDSLRLILPSDSAHP